MLWQQSRIIMRPGQFKAQHLAQHLLEVCQTGPCMLRGSDQIIEHLQKRLNIKPGETTADGLFTLKPAECLGACGYAPMMQLGKQYQENLTIEKVDVLLDQLTAASNNHP